MSPVVLINRQFGSTKPGSGEPASTHIANELKK